MALVAQCERIPLRINLSLAVGTVRCTFGSAGTTAPQISAAVWWLTRDPSGARRIAAVALSIGVIGTWLDTQLS